MALVPLFDALPEATFYTATPETVALVGSVIQVRGLSGAPANIFFVDLAAYAGESTAGRVIITPISGTYDCPGAFCGNAVVGTYNGADVVIAAPGEGVLAGEYDVELTYAEDETNAPIANVFYTFVFGADSEFDNASFDVEFLVLDEGGEGGEGGGECFWTDLVNAEQVCGAAAEPSPYAFMSSNTPSGGFLFRDEGWLAESTNLITQAIDSALGDWDAAIGIAVLARVVRVYDDDTNTLVLDLSSDPLLCTAMSDYASGDEIVRAECIGVYGMPALDAGLEISRPYGADVEFYTVEGTLLGTAFGGILVTSGV